MNSNRLITMVLIFSLVAACTNNNEARNDQNNDNNLIQVKNQSPNHSEKRSAEKIAENLVNLATSVPDVNDATALVVGNVAVIGIDVNSKIDRSRVGTIKYSVAESVKHDPHGANAIVIADPDTNVRLREMAKEIQEGRPVRGIMNELSAMIGRLMPELPADIFEQAPEEPTDTNKKQLPEGEENQMDQEQQDQSNNMKNRENSKVPSKD